MTPLGSRACDCVREYQEKVRAEWVRAAQAIDGRALWLSSKQPHGPLKSQAIQVRVKQYGRAAGIEKHVTPHVWRHTCATHLVQNSANLRHVQDLLGHGSLATTERYLRLTIADLKEAHARFHPREQRNDPL
jgi:integrase/recombinase XerD